MAVVDKYNDTVFKVMFPRLVILVRDEIPETREKKTKGTISSFNRLTKTELPRLKTKISMNTFSSNGRKLE